MTQGGVIETGIFWPARWGASGLEVGFLADGSGCGWLRFAGVAS